MNYRGSYRKLVGNAVAAMIAAIEIYNKPAFCYRDECVVILLLNAWELLLKAILSKSGKSIFYHKRRKQPYRTLTWQDAFGRAQAFFPKDVAPLPVQRNLELLGTYRDNAVHFYNADDFGVLVYGLAQPCIKNFRDLLEGAFRKRLEDQINWQPLPLGVRPSIDVVSYISGTSKSGDIKKNAVRQFLSVLAGAVKEVEIAGGDTGRLLTAFTVKLESVKKIEEADVVVGVKKAEGSAGPLAVIKIQDPNISHPLRQKEAVEKVASLHGKPFTSHGFQAVVWKHNLKANPQYCWMATEGVLIRYSNELIAFIQRLAPAAFEAALKDYRQYLRDKARNSKKR